LWVTAMLLCLCVSVGTEVVVANESLWAMVVITDIMKRSQSLSTADELIFIDSTSSCDAMQSIVTTVLTASPAGALPLAILLHEGQSTEAYKSALSLLQLHYPHCFNGRPVCQPMIFQLLRLEI